MTTEAAAGSMLQTAAAPPNGETDQSKQEVRPMRRRLATLAAAASMLALLVPVASVSAESAIHVRPGHSIQAAIDSAPAGGVIHVARGTYPGNLEIARSVHLIGDHAVIVPAAADNWCLADFAFDYKKVGICVHGAIDFETGVITPISDVSIEGFTVRDFGGPGIVALGVDGFGAVRDVTANDGMGMYLNTVSNISLLDNRVYRSGGDGLFLENSSASAVVTGNTLYDNLGSGIMFINSLGGRITSNDLRGNCAGIVVASVAIYGPDSAPPSGDVSIQRNLVTSNNRLCPEVPYQTPAYGGIGIVLIGARNTIVERNDVRNNRTQSGSAIHGGGIVLLDGLIFGAAAPTGNSIRLNHLSGNTPYEIFCDGSGTLNTVSGNSGSYSGC
jgi:parallel beta-helix repeat protein